MQCANISSLSQILYAKNLPYMNDTAHNIVLLNQ